MPLHEFQCQACEHVFDELIRSEQDRRAVACPQCGAQDVARQVSVFAARSEAPAAKVPANPGGCGRCGDPAGPCGW